MNSRIKQLAEQAGMEINPRRLYDNDFPGGYLESNNDFIANNQAAVLAMLNEDGLGKFARLIVQECSKAINDGYIKPVGSSLRQRTPSEIGKMLEEHFGFGYAHGHRWDYCDHCGHDVVICGKCGNNTCNGGHGTVDGNECDVCESAYELYLITMKDAK